MAWIDTNTAYNALRARIGLDSERFPDADAAAALSVALDHLSRIFPYIEYEEVEANNGYITLEDDYDVIAIEYPLDNSPKSFIDWRWETYRSIYVDLDGETVRLWYRGQWGISTLPDYLNEDCLTAAVAYGLAAQQAESMIYWSTGQDANWAIALQRMIDSARAEWRERSIDLKWRGANRLRAFTTNIGFMEE